MKDEFIGIRVEKEHKKLIKKEAQDRGYSMASFIMAIFNRTGTGQNIKKKLKKS